MQQEHCVQVIFKNITIMINKRRNSGRNFPGVSSLILLKFILIHCMLQLHLQIHGIKDVVCLVLILIPDVPVWQRTMDGHPVRSFLQFLRQGKYRKASCHVQSGLRIQFNTVSICIFQNISCIFHDGKLHSQT